MKLKPDKGNGVVILNKYDYNKKMDAILSDTLKFELLSDDAIKLTLKRENQIKTLLTKPTIASTKNLQGTVSHWYTYRHTIWTSQNSTNPLFHETYSILHQPLFV